MAGAQKGCVCWLRPYKSELHRASPISAPSPFGRTIWAVQEEWGSPQPWKCCSPWEMGEGPVLEAGTGAGHCPSTSSTAPWTQTVTGCCRTDVALTALWRLSTSCPALPPTQSPGTFSSCSSSPSEFASGGWIFLGPAHPATLG